ncbi:DNA binding protein [Aviadenovirus bubonis]|nr:DNA binding protein [Owl adenovirus]
MKASKIHRKSLAAKRPAVVEESDEEDMRESEPTPKKKAPKVQKPSGGQPAAAPVGADCPSLEVVDVDGDMEVSLDEEEEAESEPVGDPIDADPLVFGAQRAMGLMERICEHLDLRWQGANIQPNHAIWSKIGGTYMRKVHPEYRLTFTSFDSFHAQLGRFVAAMVYAKAELDPKFVPGGVHVWRHGWFDQSATAESLSRTLPRCLHSMEMVIKPRTIEMNPSSEAGKRALSEQNAQVEKNRFGRQVVVLRFEKNGVCYKDASHSGFPHPHAHGSCATVFSDVSKAVSAMKHDLEWTAALYPRADRKRAMSSIMISTSCNCNYAAEGPISGRQVCRMTPYKLSAAEEISTEMSKSRKDMQAHKAFPHTMVYTCCNPQSGSGSSATAGRNRKAEKSCAWRISAMDLRYAYVFANELLSRVFDTKNNPTNIPEFRWNDAFAFKTDVITPVHPSDSVDPFA